MNENINKLLDLINFVRSISLFFLFCICCTFLGGLCFSRMLIWGGLLSITHLGNRGSIFLALLWLFLVYVRMEFLFFIVIYSRKLEGILFFVGLEGWYLRWSYPRRNRSSYLLTRRSSILAVSYIFKSLNGIFYLTVCISGRVVCRN